MNRQSNLSGSRSLARFAATFVCAAAAVSSASAATEHWIGVPGTSASTNWTDSANWSSPQQTYYNQVQFLGSGMSANTIFTPTSCLDATTGVSQMPIWELDFTPTNGNYTTLIKPGVTLNLAAGRGWLEVGADQLHTGSPATANAVETVTLTGAGANMTMAGSMWVDQGSPTPGDSHFITLDLSGLDSFSATGGASSEIQVGSGGAARAQGALYLAKTNSISLGNDFLVCNQSSSSNSLPCAVYLGVINTVLTGTGNFTIGGNGAVAGAWLKFNTAALGGATIPTATLGGNASDGRIVNFFVGNGSGTSVPATGSVDLTGGSVKVMARAMQLGQGGNAGATGAGTLSLDNGVVNVNSATIGNQTVGGGGAGIGVVNLGTNSVLATNASMVVNGALTLAASTGTVTAGTSGAVNVNGGGLSASTILNGGGVGSINLTNASFTLQGAAAATGSPVTVFNAVSSALTIAFPRSSAAMNVSTLSTGGSSNVVSVTSVPPSPSYPVQVVLVKYAGSIGGAGYNFALGTLPPLCAGYISNNVANNSVDLVLTQGPLTYTWNGSVNGNWDTSTANWIVNGSSSTYSDGSFAQFLDGATTGAVSIPGSVAPAGTTVSNAALTYTFTGSGGISGPGAFVKNGLGTLVIDNTGANTFAGSIAISNGTVQIGNGDANGALPGTAILDNGVLAIDRIDNTTFGNAVSGTGGLVSEGNNSALTVSGANTFTGNVIVSNNSTLKLGSANALGAGGTAIISSGSGLDANGQSATKTLVVSGSGPSGSGVLNNTGGAIYDNPGPGLATNIVLAGDATFGYAVRWDLGNANPGGSVLQTDGSARNLRLNGNGYFEWRNLSVLSPLANIDVASGNLGVVGSTTFGDPNATMTIENGAALTIYGATVYVNKKVDMQDGSTLVNASGNNSMNGAMTLEPGYPAFAASAGTTLNMSNVLSGSGVFYASGGDPTGNIVLWGASPAFTGGVQLYNGQITLNGSIGSGIQTQTGTILAGKGTANGLVDVSGAFLPGGASAAGTFTAAGGLTLEGGSTVTMDLSPSISGANDHVVVTGDLTVGGVNITINALGGLLANGSYTLFTYTGNLNGSFGTVGTASPSRFTLSLDTSTPHVVKLVVVGAPNVLVWNNGTGAGQWDAGITPNWTNLTQFKEDAFLASDTAILDDTILTAAHPSPNLTIPASTAVLPSIVTNNSTANYTIAGAGKISDGASIYKAGPSTLTISTTNDFTGNTVIAAGVLQMTGQILTTTSPLGSPTGSITISNGASLFVNLIGGYPSGDLGFGAKPIIVGGAGVDGKGAIQNKGNSIYNDSSTLTGLGQSVTLTSDTTIGGTVRWDWGYPGLPATLSTGGSNYNFTIIQPGYTQWSDLAIDTNLGNIDYWVTSGSQQTWRVAAMGSSLGNPTNVLTLHTNVLMNIVHGDTTAGDSGYAKVIHVMSNSAVQFQPSGGAGDYRLASSFIADSNSTLTFINGTGGNGTGTAISGTVTLNGLLHLQVGDSTVTFSNVISGPGGFYWDNYNNTLVFTAANTYQGITDLRSGRTLALVGNGSIMNSATISLASGATVDVSGRADHTLTLASGQTLVGNGSVAGNLTVSSGATLSPGLGGIGAFTATNALTLAGNTYMELNKTSHTNDVIVAASINGGGTLTLALLSGTFAPGDSFKLFYSPNITGSFQISPPTPGPGLAWDTSALAGGIIKVAAPPTIGSITFLGGNIVVGGTNAADAGQSFTLLMSTNIGLPVNQWTVVTNSSFDGSGAFSFTNAPTNNNEYYILRVP